MLRLTKGRRTFAAGKLLDVANLVTAAIVIGTIIGEPRVSPLVTAVALPAWAVVVVLAVLLEPADD
jgi:hypothetical protein